MLAMHSHLFSGFEGRYSVSDPITQTSCRLGAINLFQFLRKLLDLFDAARDTVPVCIPGVPRTLAIHSESSVVQALNEEVASLVTIIAPRLHRQRLILVIAVPLLLVLVFDDALNRLRSCKRPQGQGSKEVELEAWSARRIPMNDWKTEHTLSVGVMFSKLLPPCNGLARFHLCGHCDLLLCTASSSARP